MIFFKNIFAEKNNIKNAGFDEILVYAFDRLSNKNISVMSDINACIHDVEAYYRSHTADFDKRGLKYSDGGDKWIKLVAAVDSLKRAGLAAELDSRINADDFSAALKGLLSARGICFSLDNINFSSDKAITYWAAQFNEYAGQSGITVCFIDIDSDSYVMCVSTICDYAEAADAAALVGIAISSR